MAATDPSLVEKMQITGVATDRDEFLRTVGGTDASPFSQAATDDNTDTGQTAGSIKVSNSINFEGVKVTWNVGHGALADGDTVSIFLHSLGAFPPSNGDSFVCMPYITDTPGGTVHQTSGQWLVVNGTGNSIANAFNAFTFDSAFRANLVDLDGNGKFAVRIIINDPNPNSAFRFARWNEIDSDLTPPGGGIVHQGDPDEMFGVAVCDAFGAVKRDSGTVSPPGGVFGVAIVSSAGGAKRDSSVVGVLGTSTVSSEGGAKRDSGTLSVTGTSVVSSAGGANKDSGAISATGTATSASAGGVVRDSAAVAITGTATVAPVVASTIRGGASSMVGIATVLASGQKAGATEVPGNPENIFGIAVMASSGGAQRDSGAIATLGTATVASQGGAVRDSGSSSSLGTATITSQGGVIRDSGSISSLGTATVASFGGVLRGSGAIPITGVAVTTSQGGLKVDSGAVSITGVAVVDSSGAKLGDVLIDGDETFPLEMRESVTLITDGDNWWII